MKYFPGKQEMHYFYIHACMEKIIAFSQTFTKAFSQTFFYAALKYNTTVLRTKDLLRPFHRRPFKLRVIYSRKFAFDFSPFIFIAERSAHIIIININEDF